MRGVTVKALQRLVDYVWPGNVRELEHEVRRLVYSCPRDQAIDFGMISGHIRRSEAQNAEEEEGSGLDRRGLEVQLRDLERRLVVRALERTAGNQSRAARLLEVSRNGLAKRMKRHGLVAADFMA